jgi:hypothetical protein
VESAFLDEGMARPFANLSIDELERVVAQRASESTLLQAVLDELSHRKTKRAAKSVPSVGPLSGALAKTVRN